MIFDDSNSKSNDTTSNINLTNEIYPCGVKLVNG